MKLVRKITIFFMVSLISTAASAEVEAISSAPIDTSSEPATKEIPIKIPTAENKNIPQDIANKNATKASENQGPQAIPENFELKKRKKPTLKTVLPFHSFCGTKLSVIPPNTQLVMDFAQKSVLESFTYDYKNKRDQWFELEKCYTNLGWRSFESATSRSGNNQSITDEKLFVSAKLDGKPDMIATNEIAPSWKVMVPISVRYENETHYLDQNLKVKIVISIENGHLGVDQIIASPSIEKHKYETMETLKIAK